ncbi:MAG: YhcH/YjgK/YiaL family protein [Candidatus Cloacimonetes bacterium]|nr:YhcH/YjgK/YiaL family protein [Candidatus Cloacimonadota bacterium]
MIYDSITNLEMYSSIHPLFRKVIDFLKTNNMNELPVGKQELGNNMYCNVDEYETGNASEKFIECHRKFIDIQILAEGVELIGVVSREDCEIISPYDEARDFEKLSGNPEFITLKKGLFAVFFPQDGHMPCVKKEESCRVKKIVFKVPVNAED